MGSKPSSGAPPPQDKAIPDRGTLYKTGLQEVEEGHGVFTVLLLGAGDSGKSTMMRHLRRRYAKETLRSEESLKHHKGLVYTNIVRGMRKLVEAHVSAARGDATMAVRCATGEMSEETKKIAGQLIKWTMPEDPDEFQIMPGFVQNWLKLLWSDEIVQETERKEGMLRQRQLEENVRYFMQEPTFSRVMAEKFIPTDTDMINVRYRTEGSSEVRFEMDNPEPGARKRKKLQLSVIDVGGQLSERKHWVGHFEKANIVIFFSAINDWDKMMLENPRQGRHNDSLELFKLVVSCPYFEQTPVFLFLNKVDEFANKLAYVNFQDTFKEFEPPNDEKFVEGTTPSPDYFMKSINFLKKSFETLSDKHRAIYDEENSDTAKNVFTCLTCMTDIKNFDAQWDYIWGTELNSMDGRVSEKSLECAAKYINHDLPS